MSLASSYSWLQELPPNLASTDSLRPEIADLQAMRDEAWQEFCNHVTREHPGVSPGAGHPAAVPELGGVLI